MKKYYYKDGTDVKVGDITFYSEYDGEDSLPYVNILLCHKATIEELIAHFKINN